MGYGNYNLNILLVGTTLARALEPENGSRLKRRSLSKILTESLMSMLTSCKPNVASKFHDL